MGLVIGEQQQEVSGWEGDRAQPPPPPPPPSLSHPAGAAQVNGGGELLGTHHPGCSLLRFTLPAEPGSRWHLDDAIAS